MARRKAQIVRLTGAGPIIAPERGVIDMLTELLARAKRGEIKGIGYFTVDQVNSVSTDWETGCASGNLMMAGASNLQWRVAKAASE